MSAEVKFLVNVRIRISPTYSSATGIFQAKTDPAHGRWIFESALMPLEIVDYGLLCIDSSVRFFLEYITSHGFENSVYILLKTKVTSWSVRITFYI